MKLDPLDRELLNFLCSCANGRVKVVRVKSPRQASLRRLRHAGLVGMDNYLPSGSAMADWHERKQDRTPAEESKPELPPRPAAGGGGGAVVARDDLQHAIAEEAAPPRRTRKPTPTILERAKRFEAKRQAAAAKKSKPARVRPVAGSPDEPPAQASAAAPERPNEARPAFEQNTQEASGTAREAPGAVESTTAQRILDRASTPEPAPIAPPARAPRISGAELMAEVDAFIATNGLSASRFSKLAFGRPSALREMRRTAVPIDSTIERARAFMANPPPEAFAPRRTGRPRGVSILPATDAQRVHRARIGGAVRRGINNRAQARIDAGLPPSLSSGANVKLAQETLIRQQVEIDRLADPVEKAKTVLRKRFAPVVNAEVVDGPAGKYLVGRKFVSKAELLAWADRLAA